MPKRPHEPGATHFWLELTEEEAAAITAGVLPSSVQEQVEWMYRWQERDTLYVKAEKSDG